MRSKREIEFEMHMNELRIGSLDRMAVEVSPWSSQFRDIETEIKKLYDKQAQLGLEVMALNQAESKTP